ncbi:MAG: TIGR02147 family protein [Bdellovibrionota bacterium]
MVKKKLSVYRYHDYKRYFEDLIKLNGVNGLTLRKLALMLEISPSYLSQVISGKKDFSADILKKFRKVLRIDKYEMQHLTELLSLSRSENQKEKIAIFDKIIKDKKYQKNNPEELEAYSYLSHWYFVALKEYFTFNPKISSYSDIRNSFAHKIKDSEIKKAINFLVKEKFIEISEDSQVKILKEQVDCYSDIYRLSLSSFHKQMFNLAIESIYLTVRENRLILGNTVSLSEGGFKKVKDIIQKAHEEIADIEKQEAGKSQVYHIGLAAFPLTKKRVG